MPWAVSAQLVIRVPDEQTLTRALIAPAGLAVLVGAEHEPEFKQALIDGLAPCRTTDGSYRFANSYHYLIARVPGGSGCHFQSAVAAVGNPATGSPE